MGRRQQCMEEIWLEVGCCAAADAARMLCGLLLRVAALLLGLAALPVRYSPAPCSSLPFSWQVWVAPSNLCLRPALLDHPACRPCCVCPCRYDVSIQLTAYVAKYTPLEAGQQATEEVRHFLWGSLLPPHPKIQTQQAPEE